MGWANLYLVLSQSGLERLDAAVTRWEGGILNWIWEWRALNISIKVDIPAAVSGGIELHRRHSCSALAAHLSSAFILIYWER